MTNDDLRAKFKSWRDSLPAKHWFKHDLSGAWEPWQACHAAMQGEGVVRDAARYRFLINGELDRSESIQHMWAQCKTASPSKAEWDAAIDMAMGERHG